MVSHSSTETAEGDGLNTIDYSLFGIPWKQKARTAVFGVAYDATSELAKGTLAFPAAIRLASYGLEHGPLDASDFADVLPPTSPELMAAGVRDFMGGLWDAGFRQFFVMGGNHSVTIPVVEFLAEHGLKRYVQFDAHPDFYDELLGSRYSFACTLKRASELVDVAVIGTRSADTSGKEFEGLEVIPGKSAVERRKEVVRLVRKAGYVSVDMDVFNIPHVTNPQPHDALTLNFVLDSLEGTKTAVDVVEGVPQKLYGDLAGTYGAIIARKAIELMGVKNED
jgi:agmatinase